MKKILFVLGFISLMGCEPDLCQDCYTVYYSDGNSDWVCVEYNCEDGYERL